MIPRRTVKIKFFLSVVIPVVKAAFVPFSAIGENPANAGIARLCGISPCPVPDTATALPNQARYQLRYTRIFNFCHDTTAGEKAKACSAYGQVPRETPERYPCRDTGTIPTYPTMARRKKQQWGAENLRPTVICRFTRLPVSLAVPTAALRPPGTDPRRWTAGTCRPSAAPDSGR